MYAPRDRWYDEVVDAAGEILCRRGDGCGGSTVHSIHVRVDRANPKAFCTRSGGYLVYAAFTHETVFDLREDDIYWATADIGWVTGHSYIVYGPLANGATTVMFEGVPNYPDHGPILAGRRQAPSDDLVFISYRDSLADA